MIVSLIVPQNQRTVGTWAPQHYEVYASVGILWTATTENESALVLLSITHIHPGSQGILALWNLIYAALSRQLCIQLFYPIRTFSFPKAFYNQIIPC